MKRFSCGDNEVFFENSLCLACRRELGFIPEILEICALDRVGDDRYHARNTRVTGRLYRKCLNYSDQGVCNWMVDAEEAQPYCLACRLNQMIPDLSLAENHAYWREIEQAKRRLIYSLLALDLPIVSRNEDPKYGLAFQFLADTSWESEFSDMSGGGIPIMTGHNQGLITINIAEADPSYREQMRKEMGESYRTLIGHFRHEIGHYYWYRLIHDTPWQARFRELFGDETRDYSGALNFYYSKGPPPQWQEYYISAYAASHPWEDWAECWAHYLHIIDTLETAQASRLLARGNLLASLSTRRQTLSAAMLTLPIDSILSVWVDLSIVMNNINRSIGLGDFYPFVINRQVTRKLGFIHDLIAARIRNHAGDLTESVGALPVESRQ